MSWALRKKQIRYKSCCHHILLYVFMVDCFDVYATRSSSMDERNFRNIQILNLWAVATIFLSFWSIVLMFMLPYLRTLINYKDINPFVIIIFMWNPSVGSICNYLMLQRPRLPCWRGRCAGGSPVRRWSRGRWPRPPTGWTTPPTSSASQAAAAGRWSEQGE